MELELVTASGRAGSLIIPSGLSATGTSLEVNFVRDTQFRSDASSDVGTTVIAIELFDDNGNPITQLDEPLTICLEADSLPGLDSDQMCLSFYDEEEQAWLCEDNNLMDSGDNQLCGTTPHLTNFALLLSGGGASSAGWDKTMGWLTLGFTAGAVVIILASLVVLEIKMRYQTAKQTTQLRNLAMKSRSQQGL